jgi:hypothetical protein
MNSNRLNAAQLLMNFTAHENGKTCQRIHDKEFSQELEAVTQASSSDRESNAVSDERDMRWTESRREARAALHEESREALRQPEREKRVKETKVKSTESRLERARSLSKKARQSTSVEESGESVVSNPLLLDKIMAQLQFSAEARQACKEAFSKQGTLSIDAILTFLGQKQVSGQTGNTAPTVSALDVQELVSSVQTGTSANTTGPKGLKLKQEGVYTLQELREVLKPLKKGATGGGQHDAASKAQALLKGTTGSEGTDTPLDADTDHVEAPEGHLEKLSSTRIPSFSSAQESRVEVNRRDAATIGSKRQADGMSSGLQQIDPTREVDPAAWQALSSRGTSQNRPSFQVQSPTGMEASGAHSQAGGVQQMSEKLTDVLPSRGSDAGDREAEDGSNSQARPIQNNPSGQMDGRDPISGTAAWLKAGDERPFDRQANADTRNDPSSNFEIESPVQGIESFTRAGSNGSGSASSNQQGGNGPKGFPLGGDSTAGSQQTETDPAFSLSGISQSPNSSARLDEGTRKINVYQPDWTQRISEQLQDRVRQGKSSLVVELDPENLGHLTLRVEADQKHVTAWITTQNEDTRNLLLQNTSALQKHLADQGLDLSQFNVNVGDERRNQQAFAGGRDQRRDARTEGKAKAGISLLRGVHSRIQGDGSTQVLSLIA